MPIAKGEGPVGLILCPSRELARQTFEIVNGLTNTLKAGGLAGLCWLACCSLLLCHRAHSLHGVPVLSKAARQQQTRAQLDHGVPFRFLVRCIILPTCAQAATPSCARSCASVAWT